MKRLRTTTALVAALAALSPTLAPAQALTETPAENASAAAGCIAQKLAEGIAESAAQQACATPLAPEVAPEPVTPEASTEAPGAPPAAEEPASEPAPEAPAAGQAESAQPATEQPGTEHPALEHASEAQPPEAAMPEASGSAGPAAEIGAEASAEASVEPSAPEAAPAEPPAAAEPAPETMTEAPAQVPAPEASPPEAVTPPAEATTEMTPPAAAAPEAEAEAAPEAQQTLEAAVEAQQSAETGAPVANEALAAPEAVPAEGTAAPAAGQPAMQEEVITEENARSSSQDFATTVNAQPTAQPGTQPQAEEKGGLSTKEKLAILGLGAIAVGAMLNNGSEVAVNSGDRVVLQNPDGSYQVIKDDNALLRQPGSTMRTQSFADGSTRTIATKADGARIVTVYDAQRRIVQRTRIEPDGTRYVLIDDAAGAEPIDVGTLPRASTRSPEIDATDAEALRAALAATVTPERRFTLAQVRQIASVRELAPAISVETITFASGSAAIRPEQARALATLGDAIRAAIAENPREVFLIEGHTDAVGDAAYNLALSDRRAESLALALSEYFDVPAENMVVQGYGEDYLRVNTQAASEANRRASVRKITDLLQVAAK